VGADPTQDLALVLTDHAISGRLLGLTSRTPQLGDAVAAIGFPLGLPLSVTQGTVSGLNRTVQIEGYERQNLIQTDAPVNPGNSGGPLFSVSGGYVVGLVDLLASGANGLGFAVSGDTARHQFAAWETTPQPVRSVSCATTQAATPIIPPSAIPPNSVPPSVDSGNPCDPSSASYDPTTCNAGTTSPDSGNPCDPSSAAYNSTTCNGGTTSTDSGNPCDPSSSSYDPANCNAGTTNPDSGAGAPTTSGTTSTDSRNPCDPASTSYDPSNCPTSASP
jgi:hypothetical protein